MSVGVAAHITAASVGGPRYDAFLTAAERASADNGIWLCQNHGKLVDNDATRFAVALLREWKVDAEKSALRDLDAPKRRGDDRGASSHPADSGISQALLALHSTCVHKILNTARPPQHLRDSFPVEWLTLAQEWDGEVHRVMTAIGCRPEEIHFVHTFPLGLLRRSDLRLQELNSQWTICDMRRERLEKVIDAYSETPIFTR